MRSVESFIECAQVQADMLQDLYRWYKCYIVSKMILALHSMLKLEPGSAGPGMRKKCTVPQETVQVFWRFSLFYTYLKN